MKIPLKMVVGIIGVTLALGWSLQGVDFHEVVTIVKEMNGLLTLSVLFLTTFNIIIRAIVWKYIVSPLKPVSLTNALSTYLIGVFSNLFLPFKLGDVAQGYSLGRKQHISKVSVISAVLIQRIFEISSLFFVMAFVGVIFSVPLLFSRRTVWLGIIVLLAISVIFMLYRNKTLLINRSQHILDSISPKISNHLVKFFSLFIEGITTINKLTDVVRIFMLSLLSWVVQICMVKLTADAMDIHIDIVASSVVLLIINMGLIIPIAPGNIGTFQFFSIIALSMFSVSKSKSLTFALIFQAIQGVPVIIGGGISLFREIIESKQLHKETLFGKKKITISNESL